MISDIKEKYENIFLATTALDEFWDETKPLIFVGEWCIPYEHRAYGKSHGGKLLKNPFDSKDLACEAALYVDSIYERLLPPLGEAMNTIHGTQHGIRYWRILVGPWLHNYISVLYDRYRYVKAALEQYPNLTTVLLPDESCITPTDTIDFIHHIRKDSYNLQIFSNIFRFLGKDFPVGHIIGSDDINTIYPPRQSLLKKNIKNALSRSYATIYSRIFHSIVMRHSYFTKSMEFRLMWKSEGSVLPIWGTPVGPYSFRFDVALRESLKGITILGSEFEYCLSNMLPKDMPKCFLEGFETINREITGIYPKNVKAIFTSNAWYYDEPFKFWAAACAERDTLLLGAQHGGNYGSLAVMHSEAHETAIVDRYYSWGWERSDCQAKVVPMPAPILCGRKKLAASNRRTGILWVPTQHERYLIQFPYFLPTYALDYIDSQIRFAGALKKDIRAEFRIRHKPLDYGWRLAQRLAESFPDIPADPLEISFFESLKNCRLYVCDHLSTTFIEALAANKPSILFWNPELYTVRTEAQPYYDLLRKTRILFDKPEDAATTVNEVYEDIEIWWNAPERQSAVKAFCQRFALTPSNAIELWVEEFKNLL